MFSYLFCLANSQKPQTVQFSVKYALCVSVFFIKNFGIAGTLVY